MEYRRVLMKCGHVAEGTWNDNGEEKPCCPICFGLDPLSVEVAEDASLDGRVAKCLYCKKETPSSQNLPFFEYLYLRDHDSYYCGCRGWD